MIRITRRSALPAASVLTVLLVAGCGGSSSTKAGSASSPDAAAGASASSSAPKAPTAPAPGTPAAAGGTGSGTLTITGTGGGTYQFDKVDCAGKKDPADDILTTATSSTNPDITALISRSGGKPTVLFTIGGASTSMWADASGAGPNAFTRTVGTVTLTGVPVERTNGLLSDKATGTLSGTLTCASTAALV